MENNKQEKELDLLDLIKIFWNFSKSYVFKPIAIAIKIGLKRWYIFLVAILLGIALSIFVPNVIIKKNKAEVILKNNVSISSNYVKEIGVLSEMNKTRLATLLQLDDEVMDNLIKLKPHYVVTKDSTMVNYSIDKDDVMNSSKSDKYRALSSLFALEVLAKDTAMLPILADAVINYLNERSSFSVLNNRRLSNMRSELVIFRKEIQVLDSLRYIQYFTSDANQVVLGSSGETFNIKDKNQWIQSDLIALKSKVVALEHTLNNDTLAVEELTALSISDVYDNHPFRTAPKYCIFFFILAFVFALYIEYKEEFKGWLKG